MPNTERIIARWVSGASNAERGPSTAGGADDDDHIGRIVVVDTDDHIPALVSSGLIDGDVALLHRGNSVHPRAAVADAAGWRRTYAGSFLRSGTDVVVADGFLLRQVSYGLGDFTPLDVPTALVVMDEHDFSAFLRDADAAWATGVFANHVTHPLAVLANVAALGGNATSSGPGCRLFVGPDGAVSTSPFGAVLGRAEDGPAVMADRWSAAHEVEPVDAVSLRSVVRESDRLDAVRERAWLGRYFQAASALRTIRAEHLYPGRVSGFGGRIGDPSVTGVPHPDRPALPVLVEVGRSVRAIDPASGAWAALTAGQAATTEQLIDRPHRDVDAADVAELLRVLAGGGLDTTWIDTVATTAGGQR